MNTAMKKMSAHSIFSTINSFLSFSFYITALKFLVSFMFGLTLVTVLFKSKANNE